MSESNVVGGMANVAIDAVEKAGMTAFATAEELVNVAVASANRAVAVGDKTADAVLEEAKGMFADAIASVRRVVAEVTEPLP